MEGSLFFLKTKRNWHYLVCCYKKVDIFKEHFATNLTFFIAMLEFVSENKYSQ